MKSMLRPLGTPIVAVAGVLQLIFWFVAWAKWLGGLGVIIGIFLTPGVLIFPIIYWIVEGVFPTVYFALMFAGWFGALLKRSQSVNQTISSPTTSRVLFANHRAHSPCAHQTNLHKFFINSLFRKCKDHRAATFPARRSIHAFCSSHIL